MKKAVLFDLDGTLLNTLGDLTAAVNHALMRQGFPVRTEAEVRSFVGDGVKELIARACPSDTADEIRQSVLEAYLPFYATHNADKTLPYDGVLALLQSLREAGYVLGVVSNKHEAGTVALCRRFFGETLDVVVGGGAARPLKPAPDSLLYAMEQIGVIPQNVWFVGDSVVDVQTARAAGVRGIAVTWGFQDEERLVAECPAALVHTPEEIKHIVLAKK